MQSTFDKLYEEGKTDKNFTSLMPLIMSESNIMLAYRNIKRNKGSKTSGTDKLNIENINDIEINVFIEKVQIMFKNYKPQKVRRVEIPKDDGSGKMRPLGIPTITDRLVQQCILQILEPICEAKFSDNSYGFRPNRSCENAISKAQFCMQKKHMHYCVDVDIKGFFDNVNHGKLLKQIWALGIRDKSLLSIISKILKSEIIMPNGEIVTSDKGTPQGGIISPLLSNIVLNELDQWVNNQWSEKELANIKPMFDKKDGHRNRGNEYKHMRTKTTLKEMHIVRYADDFKIFTSDYYTAKKIFEAVKLWLKDRLNLDISPEKSKITNLRKHYTVFLGFKLKVHSKSGKQVVKSHISDKARKKIIRDIVNQVKKTQHSKTINTDLWLLNSKIIGYHNYYQIATHCSLDFGAIAFVVRKSIKHRLQPKKTGNVTGYIKKAYGNSKQLRFVADIPIVPIGYIKTKNAMDKKKSINDYTVSGRNEIHKNLINSNTAVLHFLMENPSKDDSVELHNNKIALYSGQNGKCYITGEILEIHDMQCHHKTLKSKKKDDSYNNLVYVTSDVHVLIHATVESTISNYLSKLKLNTTQINKINKLRKMIELPCLC